MRRNDGVAHFATTWGAILGGIVGFFTYWAGAAFAAARDLAAMPRDEAIGEFRRPLETFTYWEVALVLAGACIGVAIVRYRWRLAGLLGFVGLLSLSIGYVAYAVWVSIPSVPADVRWLSWLLLSAEAGLLCLVLMAAFYSLDVATRRRWDRLPRQRPFDPDARPKTAVMIPLFNEPPEMVEATIAHLLRQDYPSDRFTVMVLDDSTDTSIRRRLQAYCAETGAWYVRRPTRRGYKAGAINHATSLLDPSWECIGIVDADYWVRPDWLRSVVGHFADPSIGFVQTPQDYRNKDQSFLTRQYHRAEAYFYHAMMPSRNEENAIIFCGTMGILRRQALDDVGGFAEDQICEDAEISVRLVAQGWNSLYVDRSFGEGLMPATFDAYKKQFHRWAFGNVRILFTRGWTIFRSRMRTRQKVDYITSNLHWFDGFFLAIVAGSLLYLGLAPIVGYEARTYHQEEIKLIALVPGLLLVDSLLRLHLVLRQAGRARWREAFLVQGMWFAIKWTNLVAVLKCILGFKAPFVRTPKEPGVALSRTAAFFRALRVTKFESLMAAALWGVAIADLVVLWDRPASHAVLPVWLALYAVFFLSAPLYAYLSYRTLRPLEFRPVAAPALTPDPSRQVRFQRVRTKA